MESASRENNLYHNFKNMPLTPEIEAAVQRIKIETKQFETCLRTSFLVKDQHPHTTIRIVNNKCATLKAHISEIISKITDNDYSRIRATIDSARFYINKYEQAIDNNLTLEWDILELLWRFHQKKED